MKKMKIKRVLVIGSSGVVGHGVSTDLIKNNYFVLGDNTANALDSRYWGVLPRSWIIGKVISIQPVAGGDAAR